MTEAIRQIYWNVGEVLGSLTVYVTALAAMLVLFYGILRDVATWRKGRPDARLDAFGSRVSEMLVQSLGQKKTLQDRKPGMMHALIFFGFLGLFIGTDVIAGVQQLAVDGVAEGRHGEHGRCLHLDGLGRLDRAVVERAGLP